MSNPPTVTITSPADPSTYNLGRSVSFAGTAGDAEDGDPTASLSWTSDLGAAIGSDGSFETSTLSTGTHPFTAAVTDAMGLPATRTSR